MCQCANVLIEYNIKKATSLSLMAFLFSICLQLEPCSCISLAYYHISKSAHYLLDVTILSSGIYQVLDLPPIFQLYQLK